MTQAHPIPQARTALDTLFTLTAGATYLLEVQGGPVVLYEIEAANQAAANAAAPPGGGHVLREGDVRRPPDRLEHTSAAGTFLFAEAAGTPATLVCTES